MRSWQENQRRKRATELEKCNDAVRALNVMLAEANSKIAKLKELLRQRVEGPYKYDGDTDWYECVYCHKGISGGDGLPKNIVHRDSCWLLAAREALWADPPQDERPVPEPILRQREEELYEEEE